MVKVLMCFILAVFIAFSTPSFGQDLTGPLAFGPELTEPLDGNLKFESSFAKTFERDVRIKFGMGPGFRITYWITPQFGFGPEFNTVFIRDIGGATEDQVPTLVVGPRIRF
jgi:hypothetical protein